MQLHKTQKCSKTVVKFSTNYNLLTICFTISNVRVATEYKPRATNCNFQACSFPHHDHKQQLTFFQRFKLIGLYPAYNVANRRGDIRRQWTLK